MERIYNKNDVLNYFFKSYGTDIGKALPGNFVNEDCLRFSTIKERSVVDISVSNTAFFTSSKKFERLFNDKSWQYYIFSKLNNKKEKEAYLKSWQDEDINQLLIFQNLHLFF